MRLKKIVNVLAALAIVLGLVATNATPATASHGGFRGVVKDAVTLVGIPGVCVIVGPALVTCAAMTDANGNYDNPQPNMPDFLVDSFGWELNFLKRPEYADTKVTNVKANNVPITVLMQPTGAPPAPAPGTCAAASTAVATQTVYLPNVTKTLGGPTGFQTPFIVQNTGTIATNLEVSFYKFSDGSCVARRTVNALAAGTSFADVPNNDSDLPADSQFSVVVKSFGAPVVSVVNEHAGFGDRAEALSYVGAKAGAASVFLPNIVRRFFGYHTPFIIQNLGTVATTASATFKPFNGGASVTITRSIAPGQSQFIEPNVEGTLADGTQYAVNVTSAQPIAVVVNTHNDDANVAQPVAYATNGITTGAASVFGPYAAKNANDQGFTGTISTIVVQNLGSAPVTPTLTFTPLGGGTATTFTGPSTAAGSSWAFDPRYSGGNSATGTFCGSAASTGCLGDGEYSFVATAVGGTLAAAVNVISPATAMGYTASATPSAKFFLPNVTRTLGGANGWTTPILLQTVGATGATIEWRRFSDGALVTTQNLTITAGSGIRIDPRTVAGLTDDTQYAVTITGTGGTVTAIVTELNFSGGDGAMIYEGFTSP